MQNHMLIVTSHVIFGASQTLDACLPEYAAAVWPSLVPGAHYGLLLVPKLLH